MGKYHLFIDIILKWYTNNRRYLPWQEDRSPYKVWLSEVILQQTRVQQGIPYYSKFIDLFPDIYALAAANENQVFKAWEGLGYYTRAKNLHATAKKVVSEFGGVFPDQYETLLSLPGIGKYTAAAIVSFTNNQPIPAIDGNFYRLIGRIWGIDLSIQSKEGQKEFHLIGNQIVNSTKHPGTVNQAIMDFASLICSPKKPLCLQCPMKEICNAFKIDAVDLYPIKKTKALKKQSHLVFFIDKNKVMIRKRKEGGIWGSLYDFPNLEGDLSFVKSINNIKKELGENDQDPFLVLDHCVHQLTHKTLHIQFVEICCNIALENIWNKKGYSVIESKYLKDYPFPKPIIDFITNHLYHV